MPILWRRFSILLRLKSSEISKFKYFQIRSFLNEMSGDCKFNILVDSMHGVTGPYVSHILVDRFGARADCCLRTVPKPDFGGMFFSFLYFIFSKDVILIQILHMQRVWLIRWQRVNLILVLLLTAMGYYFYLFCRTRFRIVI